MMKVRTTKTTEDTSDQERTSHEGSSFQKHELIHTVTSELEYKVGVTVEELTDLLILGSINQFGPQKFKELYSAGVKPRDVLSNPDLLPMKGKRASSFAAEIRKITLEIRELWEQRARKQMVAAEKHQAKILTYDSPYYPRNVYESNSPTPVLYARGDFVVLLERRSSAASAHATLGHLTPTCRHILLRRPHNKALLWSQALL